MPTRLASRVRCGAWPYGRRGAVPAGRPRRARPGRRTTAPGRPPPRARSCRGARRFVTCAAPGPAALPGCSWLRAPGLAARRGPVPGKGTSPKGIASPHSMLTIYRRLSTIVLQGEIMNHTHNTHAQDHIASRSSRRRHAWHAAAQHSGRRPPWAGQAGADKSGQRPHPGGQPRHTGGHAASPGSTSPRRRPCGRVRARRPADHCSRRPAPADHAADAEPAGACRLARIPGRQRPQQQAARRTCAAPRGGQDAWLDHPRHRGLLDGAGGCGQPVPYRRDHRSGDHKDRTSAYPPGPAARSRRRVQRPGSRRARCAGRCR